MVLSRLKIVRCHMICSFKLLGTSRKNPSFWTHLIYYYGMVQIATILCSVVFRVHMYVCTDVMYVCIHVGTKNVAWIIGLFVYIALVIDFFRICFASLCMKFWNRLCNISYVSVYWSFVPISFGFMVVAGWVGLPFEFVLHVGAMEI